MIRIKMISAEEANYILMEKFKMVEIMFLDARQYSWFANGEKVIWQCFEVVDGMPDNIHGFTSKEHAIAWANSQNKSYAFEG